MYILQESWRWQGRGAPDDGMDADVLISCADAAMYTAKLQAPNGYHAYRPAMGSTSAEIWTKEQELRKALEHNEFELSYQPRVDARKGETLSVEALIRRSFIHNINKSHQDAAVVRSIITLGHSFNLKVVAEGVENEGQQA